MEQKFKCEDHNPIVLVSENIDDHLVDYTKGEHDGSPVNKKDTSQEDSSNNNQQKVYIVGHSSIRESPKIPEILNTSFKFKNWLKTLYFLQGSC